MSRHEEIGFETEVCQHLGKHAGRLYTEGDAVTEYLRQVLEDGDPVELGAALGDIARARGMSQLARDTGLSRESFYKSPAGERAPHSDTLFKVMRALGFQLTIASAPPR